MGSDLCRSGDGNIKSCGGSKFYSLLRDFACMYYISTIVKSRSSVSLKKHFSQSVLEIHKICYTRSINYNNYVYFCLDQPAQNVIILV
jgi:hypothetical protein